jgi:hypothetical protein
MRRKPTMPTTMPGTAAAVRASTFTDVLGKVLAVGILLTPLVMMLFPELNHRSGNVPSGGKQRATAVQTVAGGGSLHQFHQEGDE